MELVEKVRDILGDLQDTFWGQRIIAAAERGYFNSEDEALAENWTTCACGKTSVDLLDGVVPADDELFELGMQFSLYVEVKSSNNDDLLDAAATLVEIENRAIALSSKKRNANINN